VDVNVKDDRWCFACGTENPCGLHMPDIHLEGHECVCRFTPGRAHQGWSGILHGGLTSTLLDEIMTHLLWRRGFDAVTAEMTVRFKSRIVVDEPLEIRARITRRRGRLAETEGQVTLADGTLAATASAKFMCSPRDPDTPGARLSLASRESVIFDLFGTLVPVFHREAYHAMLAEMAGHLGVAPEEFASAFRADARRRVTGHWDTLEEHVADLAACRGWEVSPAQVADAVKVRVDFTLASLLHPYPDALAALEVLGAAGRRVALISDCSPETPALWHLSPLARYIPQPVFSPTAGVRKPDPAIYRQALDRNGLNPMRTVYVGDGDSHELAGARALGILPVLVDRGEESAFRVAPSREGVDVIVYDLVELLPLIGLEAPAGPRA
jgi:putative hydrolase of the HAD superfamily